jgi:hypothetical protein
MSSAQRLDRLSVTIQRTKLGSLFMALLGLAACRSAGDADGGEFGPSTAEREIREAFGFGGAIPRYEELVRLAAARNMTHEPLEYDHSLIHCRVNPRAPGLRFEMFYAGRARNMRATLNYVVVYDRNGSVVCIETRHAYPPL